MSIQTEFWKEMKDKVRFCGDKCSVDCHFGEIVTCNLFGACFDPSPVWDGKSYSYIKTRHKQCIKYFGEE